MGYGPLGQLMFRLPVSEYTPGERLVLHYVGWDADRSGRRTFLTKRKLVEHTGFQPEKITQTLVKAERNGRVELKRDSQGRIIDWRVKPIPAKCGNLRGKPVQKPADSPRGSLSTIDGGRSAEGGPVDPTIDESAVTRGLFEGSDADPSLDPSFDPSRATEASLRAATPPESSKPPTPNPIDTEAERRAFLERARRAVFGGVES